MTEAEKKALELYPDKPTMDIQGWGKLQLSEYERKAFLKGVEYANQSKQEEVKPQPQEKVDLISLSMQHLYKMNKELDETGLVPNWWRGVVTISMTAIEELAVNTLQNNGLREAAEEYLNVVNNAMSFDNMVEYHKTAKAARDEMQKALNQKQIR